MGLDQPALVRYVAWIGGVFTGNFGISYSYGVPVAGLIADRLTVTLPLTLMAITLSLSVALPLGVFAAARQRGTTDAVATFYSQIGIAVPNFWLGLLLILFFALSLGWFPAGGFRGWGQGILAGLQALVLPAIALAMPQSAILTRVTRSAVLDVMNEDFVRTARAKGISRNRALWRHAVPNALVPVVTILGLQILVPARRRRDGRERVQPARHRPPRLPGAGAARPDRDQERRPVLRRHRHRGQPDRRCGLPLARPAPASHAHERDPTRSQALHAPRAGVAICGSRRRGDYGRVRRRRAAGAGLDAGTPDPAAHPAEAAAAAGDGLLGTDHLGRDVLSMLMAGAFNSLSIAALSVLVGMTIGTALGVAAAAKRGLFEAVIMRICDAMFAFPPILSAIMVGALLGPGALTAVLAIGTFMVPVFARVTRGAALQIWAREYVLAARMAGRSGLSITARTCDAEHRQPHHHPGRDPAGAGDPHRGRS